jgi:hypothetical protein
MIVALKKVIRIDAYQEWNNFGLQKINSRCYIEEASLQ